jgi:DNA-binding NarL/FixJ family response regulator
MAESAGLAAAACRSSRERQVAPAGDADIAVLIVDDHVLEAEALTAALGDEAGMVVTGAVRTLGECVAVLAARHVDVVLMDSVLPDGGGTQHALRMVQSHPGVRVVLLCTGGRTGRVTAACARRVGHANREGSVADLSSVIRDVHRGVPRGAVGAGGHSPRGPSPAFADELTIRELEVLQLLGHGRSTADICATLGISSHTLRNHVSNVLGKLGVHSKLKAVSVALSSGLIARPGEDFSPPRVAPAARQAQRVPGARQRRARR